ncbi:hypothetical protein Tco_1406935 [Tanacetum coccineum]
MSTPIDFSAFVMNHLQISDLTQDILVGLAYNILKGTCRSYVKLKYNMEECYKALTDQLDWNNPEGESTSRTYMTSLTKTKAAKYDLPGIEDMVPNLWSPIKVAYDKHAFLVTNVKLNVCYQKKLNISKPRKRKEALSRRAPYTTLSDSQRVIYEDKLNRKRLMHFNKLHKFIDGTLQSVRDTLLDMDTNLRMRNRVNTYAIRNTKLLSGIEDSHHGPSDAMHNPPQPLKVDPHGFEDTYKYGNGGTWFQQSQRFIATCSYSTDILLKLKNFKKDEYTSFQDQEQYEHVGTKVISTQDGKRSQDDDKRLYSADDLKKLKDHMRVKLKGTSSSLKSKDHYAYHKLKDKIQDHEQRPKTFVEC